MKRILLAALAVSCFPVAAQAATTRAPVLDDGADCADPADFPGGKIPAGMKRCGSTASTISTTSAGTAGSIIYHPPVNLGPNVSFEKNVWNLGFDTNTYYGNVIPGALTNALDNMGIHPRAEIDTNGKAWIESYSANGHFPGFGFSAHAGALAQIGPNVSKSGTFDASAVYYRLSDSFCVDATAVDFGGNVLNLFHQCATNPISASPDVFWYAGDNYAIDKLIDLGPGGNLHVQGSATYTGSARGMFRVGANPYAEDPRLGWSVELVGRASLVGSADVTARVNPPDPLGGFDLPDYSVTVHLIDNAPLQETGKATNLLDARASVGFDSDVDDAGNRTPDMYVQANAGYGWNEQTQTYVQLPALVSFDAVVPAIPSISSFNDIRNIVNSTPAQRQAMFQQSFKDSYVTLPVSNLWGGFIWTTPVPW
jgi:hypothetical protein